MSILCNSSALQSHSKSIMDDISEDVFNSLASLKVKNVYKKGQTIFYEGNKPYGVYWLKSGKVKLYKTNNEGKTFIVNIAGEGDLLGYRYFFTQEMYSTTAEVIEDATVCFLDKDSFLDLLRIYPALTMELLDLMGHEIQNSENTAARMAYDSTHERIAGMILDLKETYGVKYDGNNNDVPSWKIDVLLTRNDLASLAGTTTETIVRVMSLLKEKNIVKTENKFMCITDLKALERLIPEH